MDDLINRKALLEVIGKSTYVTSTYFGRNDRREWIDRDRVFAVINGAPAIAAEPVQRGKWVAEDDMLPPEYRGKKRCSICAQFALHDLYGRERLSHYCPNCGTKMDGESDG